MVSPHRQLHEDDDESHHNKNAKYILRGKIKISKEANLVVHRDAIRVQRQTSMPTMHILSEFRVCIEKYSEIYLDWVNIISCEYS